MNQNKYLVQYGSYFYYMSFDSIKHRLLFSSINDIANINSINISDFKLFVILGRNELLFKFFSKYSFSLFFAGESYDRTKFYHEVYPDYPKFLSNQKQIDVLNQLYHNIIGFQHYLYLYTKRRISKLKMYYNHQLYDFLSNSSNLSFIFYYSQSVIIKKVFGLLFNNIYRMIIPAKEKKIITKKKQEHLALIKKTEDMMFIDDEDDNEFAFTDYEGNVIQDLIHFKHRTKIAKSKKNSLKCNTIGASKGESNFIRSLSKQKILYPKIVMIFDIITTHVFSQELSSLELDDNGNIILALKENSKERTQFNINDITSMDTTSKRNLISLHLTNNNKIQLEFTQFFYKYVFKSIVYTHMLANLNKEHYKHKIQINFVCITWNIAGIDVPSDLGSVFNESKFHNVDFLSIGVQECSVFKTKNWQKHLKILLEYYDYECVESVKMCQMFLMVFVKKDLRKFVEQVEIYSKPMGFAKVIGNKGGMVIAFQFLGYQFVVVNCHLSPKPYKVLDRNEMVRHTIQTFRIGNKTADFDVLADYTIWGGDLNYRISLTWVETVNYLKINRLEALYEQDQLTRQKNTNVVFTLYKEPIITFLPTYRRIKKKEQFDGSVEEAKEKHIDENAEESTHTLDYSNKLGQSPSWCDRILIKTNREIDYLSYTALDNIKHSDHFPVEAHFNIYLTIPFINNEKLNKGTFGSFEFANIVLSYQFEELFEILQIPIVYPFTLMIRLQHYLSDKNQETMKIMVPSEKESQQIQFENISFEIMPQFVFDFPQAKAINFYFVLLLILDKANHIEIGYAKYCLEDIENKGHSILNSNCKLDISYLTKKMGSLSFNYIYKN